MIKEYQLIMENDVQDAVPRPEGNFVVSSMWIYKIKHETEWQQQGVQSKVHGFSQKEGVDYGEMCSVDQTHFSNRSVYRVEKHMYVEGCMRSKGTHG